MRYKLKRWLINILLSDGEKFLLARACEDRYETLRRLAVTEKTVDYYDTKADMQALLVIKSHYLSSNLYR
jgi:hypothetical protein